MFGIKHVNHYFSLGDGVLSSVTIIQIRNSSFPPETYKQGGVKGI